MIFLLTLKEKRQITHDVFHLIFISEGQSKIPFYGQFITLLLKAGARPYSVANSDGKTFELIIKRLENGRGGSKEICDISVGTQVKAVGPVGHFTLRETSNNRLFLGTGTGFAPLYFQLLGSYALNLGGKNKLIFGVRELEDVFFVEELEKIKKEKGDFDYEIYISGEHTGPYHHGRITQFLTPENVKDFKEVYICGNPAMMTDAKQMLEDLGIPKTSVFSEQY